MTWPNKTVYVVCCMFSVLYIFFGGGGEHCDIVLSCRETGWMMNVVVKEN